MANNVNTFVRQNGGLSIDAECPAFSGAECIKIGTFAAFWLCPFDFLSVVRLSRSVSTLSVVKGLTFSYSMLEYGNVYRSTRIYLWQDL